MSLTVEQVLALAPDAGAVAAGRKLGQAGVWRGLGRSARALWGECQGSALYQVRVDLADLAVACSCPSRKFPCKHGLGLLLLAAASPAAVPEGEPPEWVSAWLARRAERAAQRAPDAPVKKRPEKPPASADRAAARRADQRRARVAAGIEALDRWLSDLVRTGLASVATQPATFWEQQAARLVDAQAPGLAARVRRLAAIPNSSPDWPERLLGQLGRLALLTESYRRIEELEPALQEDVRGAVGWTLSREEVVARGEAQADEWLILGQRVTVEERLRAQSTWLLGARSGRFALVLQYANGRAAFPETLLPGSRLAAELVYWPSAYPLRALMARRQDKEIPMSGPVRGATTVAAFLDGAANALAQQPWLERLPCALRGVVARQEASAGVRWLLVDAEGVALPLAPGEHWRLLALSGGRPVDLLGEWGGEAVLPLGVVADGAYHRLGEDA
ncbi:MAG TPA: SWIM zinc finger family protein [Thermomicrobiaceae bacterium]|nr:SWIM zinc finger family protein [Thermomicrobiaceae bacterium]